LISLLKILSNMHCKFFIYLFIYFYFFK
jgi:hypothetical protein